MSIAKDYLDLAAMDISDFGYVQPTTARSADCEAIGGHKICSGIYILEFSDGSRLNFDKFTNELEMA